MHVYYSLFFIWPACTYGLEPPTKYENVWMNVESDIRVRACVGEWKERKEDYMYEREREREREGKNETKERRINVQQNEGEGVEGKRKIVRDWTKRGKLSEKVR